MSLLPMGVSDAINELTYKIIGCCIAVHSALGPGLLESAYLACLIVELRSAGLDVEVNVKVPIVYKGVTVDCCYRLDLLINGTVILDQERGRAVADPRSAAGDVFEAHRKTDRPPRELQRAAADAERHREKDQHQGQSAAVIAWSGRAGHRAKLRRPQAGVPGLLDSAARPPCVSVRSVTLC